MVYSAGYTVLDMVYSAGYGIQCWVYSVVGSRYLTGIPRDFAHLDSVPNRYSVLLGDQCLSLHTAQSVNRCNAVIGSEQEVVR